jgi:uncharacterized protein (DUF1330 family)
MAMDPRSCDLIDFVRVDPGAPVVMLNLLRFAPHGRDSYACYARILQVTLLPRYGAEAIYAGNAERPLVAGDGRAWDAVVLVHYPSREAYRRMVADAEYQAVTSMLTTAFQETVLQPTVPWLDL